MGFLIHITSLLQTSFLKRLLFAKKKIFPYKDSLAISHIHVKTAKKERKKDKRLVTSMLYISKKRRLKTPTHPPPSFLAYGTKSEYISCNEREGGWFLLTKPFFLFFLTGRSKNYFRTIFLKSISQFVGTCPSNVTWFDIWEFGEKYFNLQKYKLEIISKPSIYNILPNETKQK